MLEVILLVAAGWLVVGGFVVAFVIGAARQADRVERHYLRRQVERTDYGTSASWMRLYGSGRNNH